MTRPVFDVDAFERVLKRIEHTRLPVVAGVLPFESARNAEFMANEVPGVRVPEALMERMRRADGQDAAAAEGIAIAREMLDRLRVVVQGAQISAPFGKYNAAVDVLEVLGATGVATSAK